MAQGFEFQHPSEAIHQNWRLNPCVAATALPPIPV